MAANASVAAVRWGAEVAYWGRIGDDAPRQQIVARVPTVLDADVAPVAALRDLATRCDYAIFSEPGPPQRRGWSSRSRRAIARTTLDVLGRLPAELGAETAPQVHQRGRLLRAKFRKQPIMGCQLT